MQGPLLAQFECKTCFRYLYKGKPFWVCSTGLAACRCSSPRTLLACRKTRPRAMSMARDLPCLQWQACCQAVAGPEGSRYQVLGNSGIVQHTSQQGGAAIQSGCINGIRAEAAAIP